MPLERQYIPEHTSKELSGEKIVGPFPPSGTKYQRQEKPEEPVPNICNLFSAAEDKAVRHARPPCLKDIQAVALTWVPSPAFPPAPFSALPTGAACSRRTSPDRREETAMTGGPLGAFCPAQ